MQELEERLSSAYAAKTHAELEPLLTDLPEAQGHEIVSVLVSEDRFPWGHRTVALAITCINRVDARVELNVTVGEAARLASRPAAIQPES